MPCEKYPSEKIPCVACGYMMKIASYIFAYRMKIPYVLCCYDPMQITAVPPEIIEIINGFKNICGDELVYEFFGYELDVLMNSNISELPKLVYPYSTVKNYDLENFIKELEEIGLYESSPPETHCSLYTLLNYFSFKKFNCGFYSSDISALVRRGVLNRESLIKFIESYKEIILNIAPKEEITDTEKIYIKETLKFSCPTDSQLLYQYDNIMDLHNVLKELNLKLDNIGVD